MSPTAVTRYASKLEPRVTVLVAISRPAEFIEITFQQQMQKS